MQTAKLGLEGFAPIVTQRTIEQTRIDLGLDPVTGQPVAAPVGMSEKEKYQRMWGFQEYRQVAPGEGAAMLFLNQAQPKPGSTVIDFGAGTGRGALMLALIGGLKVEMLDFADNCLDPEVRQALTTQPQSLTFLEHDLTNPSPISAEYGFCTDVMEHIPPEQVDRVLQNILLAARHVFFQISLVDDVCGKLIDQPLHLSVHPFTWWLQKLQELGCAIHGSLDQGDAAVFYVSAWVDGAELSKAGVLNVTDQQVIDNVRANIAGDWINITPHETNDMEVMILGGGPSLLAGLDDIKEKRAAGVKLVTLNGTYNWALENGLTPSATIVVDAREFNERFTHPVVDACKYLISSQVHPKVLEGLPLDRTYLWHQPTPQIREMLNDRYPIWYQIPGGSTVMLRAIPLLRLLGFKKFHLYGFDSCLAENTHHAYAQPENDKDVVIDCVVSMKDGSAEGRKFLCHPWMICQAQEFMDLVKFLGNEIELEVYGDGLIAHIIKTGASKSDFLT